MIWGYHYFWKHPYLQILKVSHSLHIVCSNQEWISSNLSLQSHVFSGHVLALWEAGARSHWPEALLLVLPRSGRDWLEKNADPSIFIGYLCGRNDTSRICTKSTGARFCLAVSTTQASECSASEPSRDCFTRQFLCLNVYSSTIWTLFQFTYIFARFNYQIVS